ncbi:hypothetical protein DPX16_4856 [Anabarilius grahami]|uniref:Uncharacterized protein n=1 Tax=Anabarilius grahami TaxID=495550 RepID=A0A3N0Y185_ANAGA|nr:hypothetical protein DPX16_4856 [Anabarilius grahami]
MKLRVMSRAQLRAEAALCLQRLAASAVRTRAAGHQIMCESKSNHLLCFDSRCSRITCADQSEALCVCECTAVERIRPASVRRHQPRRAAHLHPPTARSLPSNTHTAWQSITHHATLTL